MSSPAAGWAYALGRVAVAVLVGALLGLFVGSLWAGLAGTLAAYLGLQLYQLFRLDYWLRHRNTSDPPDAGGVWGDVIAQVTRLHRRKNYHKRRMVEVLRQVRRATANMPDGAIILNADREIVWFNRRAATMLGLSRKSDLGIRLDNLVRHPSFQRYLQQAAWSDSIVLQPRATEDCWFAFQAMRIGEGQTMVLARDVSREERTDAMRRDFVANASHELRSPLTVIAGYLETLGSDEGIDPTLRAPLQEMQRQAQRMTAIVADLLELSRLDASDEQVAGEPIDVAALMGLLRKDLLARPTRPAEIRTRVESDQRLVGELGLIQSAFGNLADNAAKYTPAEGSVTLRWWADEAGGHFSVTDTGVGIAAEHLPRLTERFYRVDQGRSRATGGSGLGLAIVKHVLIRHGGDLEVRSVEGEGSTFTCHFPPSRLAAPAAAIKSA